MPYSPTTWVNDTIPALNATNLNKVTNELKAQASIRSIAHTLPTWINNLTPAISDPAPLNEMERVAKAVATSFSLSYTSTVWGSGWNPARNATRLNHLETQVQANRAAIDALPPPGGTPYWEWKGTGGLYQPLATIFESYHSDPSPFRIKNWGGLEANLYDSNYLGGSFMSTDTNLRVHLRAAPANPNGSGWTSRQEVRTTDGPWYPLVVNGGADNGGATYDKSSIRNLESDAVNTGSFAPGYTAWFAWDYFLPLNYGANNDSFNWPTSGWLTMFDLHGNGNNYEQNWNVLEGGVQPISPNNAYIAWHIGAHEGNSDPAPYDSTYINILQLSDGAGARIGGSFNVWHELVVGAKFDYNLGGHVGNPWVEIWHNGAQVLPQTFRDTCFSNETALWQQAQNYKQHGSALIGGATSNVIYYGGLRAGLTRGDVQRR